MGGILLGDVPDRNAERLGPDRWALDYDGDRIDWGELARRSRRRARALRAAGVGQGDRVLLALPNGLAFHELTFAAWKIGATPTVVSSRLPRHELTAIAGLAEARIAIAADPELQLAIGAFPAPFGRDHPDDSALPAIEAPCWKVMTSGGSTGRPKLIVDALPSRMPSDAGMLFLPRDGVIATVGPLHHNMPFATSHMAMVGGASVAGLARFDAEAFLSLVERFGVEWVTLVPTMMHRIARLPDTVRARFNVSSLKTVLHTAAPIAPGLKRFWIDWLGPEVIWEIYGGTEGFGTTMIRGDEWLAHLGSVGRPVGVEVRILGENDAELPAGEIGEICFRRPRADKTFRYVGDVARTRTNGFESFGDFGWLDADGYLYLADRRTDMIVTGGHNVFPAEVELVLLDHPAVAEAVVIGLPDEDLGARIHAIVRLEEGARRDPDALLEHIAGRFAGWKVPRQVEFTDQPLRDEAGKTRRSRLRDERISGA